MQRSNGTLYIFEGIDNVGKTTIITGVGDKLREAGIPFSKYSFPGSEPETLGSLVYDLHHNVSKYVKETINPISLQLMHIAAHIDIIYKKIIPDLMNGKIVLLDRSWWSTYAYGLASGISRKILKKIITPEIDALKKVSIAKVFLVQRNILQSDYNIKKTNLILNSYNELKSKFIESGLVEVIENNDEISNSINIVYNTIINRYDNKLYNQQVDLLRSQQYDKNIIQNFNINASGLIHSPIYDTYWKFAAKRQEIFFNRLNNVQCPWTNDPILQKYKFTNAYRASDRVSQFLIKNVIYNNRKYSPEDMFFRIILFKLFNKIETWNHLEYNFGDITFKNYNFERYDKLLMQLVENNEKIYSAAYIMPSGKSVFGSEKKHRNNLNLLEAMMKDQITQKIARIKSLKQLYELLLAYPTLGRFLAFQYSIDLNYSELCDFDEMSFVVAGPGAQRGIAKCFNTIGKYSEEEVIHCMAINQNEEFERLKLQFKDLWGRPLQLIDCQNLFCETDKYTRVAFPNVGEKSERKKIKQLYIPNSRVSIDYFYPPKWEINSQIGRR